MLWSFGYTPYLVCCWEGVVSVFCIWHVDGNSWRILAFPFWDVSIHRSCCTRLSDTNGGGRRDSWGLKVWGYKRGLTRTRSLPNPCRSGSPCPVLISLPAHGACCPFFPLHPRDCSPSAIYHFSSSFYGQREVLYMKKYLQSFLKSWAVQQITGETLANPLGRWETALLFSGGKGDSNQLQAPNVTQTHGDPEQPPPTHPCCDRNNPPLPSNPWSWGLSCKKTCWRWVGNVLCHAGLWPGFVLLDRGPQGARMLPRQEGVKGPSLWPNS